MGFGKKTMIAILFFIVLSVALVSLYREYNRKPENLSSVRPDLIVSATKLIDDYTNDEAGANQKYMGKLIQVSGELVEVNNIQATSINILIGGKSSLHKVSCIVENHAVDEIKKYSIGQPITIKGMCTGVLIDVELNRCVLVK